MSKLMQRLYRLHLISPSGLCHFLWAFFKEGLNLMALVRFSAYYYPTRQAVIDERRTLTYVELLTESGRLTNALRLRYSLKKNARVALLCRNHSEMVTALLALSRLGTHIYFLNIEMSVDQLQTQLAHSFDLVVYDFERQSDMERFCGGKKLLSSDISTLVAETPMKTLKKCTAGQMVVLTGGTSGTFKSAARKPSVFSFLNPFFALIEEAHIDDYQSLYVATPIYHGFGLSSLIVSLVMGKSLFIISHYHTENACALIRKYQIEVAAIVPLMLQRMLNADADALMSLKCILSGGALLDERLVKQSQQKLGGVLYNLYGTSEAGFSTIATPDALRKYPNTVGRPIRGLQFRVVRPNQVGFGTLEVNCAWSMDNKQQKWVSTGDLARINDEGFLFLCGRSDDMIVSAGENVYPDTLERAIMMCDDVETAVVISVADVEFGQRLKAFVVLKPNSSWDEQSLLTWLSEHVARYEMPVKVVLLDEIPLLETGKIDRRKLL